MWWLVMTRPATESWFKVAPRPQARDFDFLNTRNVTINDGPSLGHLGHLFSHQEFYSLWWRLLSDMTWCTMHEDWGTPFYGLVSFAHNHCSFPQKVATSQSTFGQCSMSIAHQIIATFPILILKVWTIHLTMLSDSLTWKEPLQWYETDEGDCRPFFQRCLSKQCWMFDACLRDVGSNLHILSRLFFSCMQIEWTATGWKESADIFHQIRHQGLPMRGVVNRFIMQRAALIMANDIPLMAIEDVIKAVCEYSPLRGQ